MARRNRALISCLLITATGGMAAAQTGAPVANGPQGVYATFVMSSAITSAQSTAYPGTPPAYPNQAADTVLVTYFTTLLSDPAISGLAPQIAWDVLNPNDPSVSPNTAYTWNPLDDLFIAVNQWNSANPTLAPKTIQLIVSPGFNSPGWVFSNIDSAVCGLNSNCSGAGSCDGLFMKPSPAVSPMCGYTTLFFRVESNPIEQIPLPLPWNSVYKNDWHPFLAALNQRVQQEPSSSAFVAISMAGPTASSAEMILPNAANEGPYTCGNGNKLGLNETLATDPTTGNVTPVCPLTGPGFDLPTAWNMLFQNYYGSNPNYQNSDQAFIDEWNAAIDAYGQIFSGVTLVLTTTTDALPTFPAANSSLLVAATGFEPDCDDAISGPNADVSDAMACATVTQVLTHFTNPTVGGNNTKGTQESGLTAARDGIDLGTNGIKWLASATAGGATALPGTPYNMSQILGGLQFNKSFSLTGTVQATGCPDYTPSNQMPATCVGLTPAEGLENVLSISYFPGTAVGPFFCADTDVSTYGCATASVTHGNFQYTNAPMNFLQVYDVDIIYALGLSQCSMLQITGRPASTGVAAKAPNTSGCAAQSPPDAPTAQAELTLASQKLLSITEPPAFFTGEVSLGSNVEYLEFPNSTVFGYYTFVASDIFYHYDMGYEAFAFNSTPNMYLYDFTSGHWWYASNTLFPYIYDFTLSAWIYYFPNTKSAGHYTAEPRYFSNLTTGKIFTM
jgi:hypothetical protein